MIKLNRIFGFPVVIFLVLMVFIVPSQSYSHGDSHEGDDQAMTEKGMPSNQEALEEGSVEMPHSVAEDGGERSFFDKIMIKDIFKIQLPIHPLVVHIPVIFIPLAWLLFLLSVLLRKKSLFLVVPVIFVGFVGAFLAGRIFHPHTYGLPPAAQLILEKHDLFADATILFALLSLLVGLGSLFLKASGWKVLFFIFLTLATLSVVVTGHYGASLVYEHGVGVQGAYIED